MLLKIAVIGEFKSNNLTHVKLNSALEDFSIIKNCKIEYNWIDTNLLEENPSKILKDYHGIWSAPGSPFNSLKGALNAIEYARNNDVPHLGTCAGFQHSVVEIAKDMLGYEAAQHEEYNPESSELFINKLVCSLAGKTMQVNIKEGTKAFELYRANMASEDYYCNFGINPAFLHKLVHPTLVFSGIDQEDEIRILELTDKRFFMATLFVPQSKSTQENPHPIISGFIDAVYGNAAL